MKIDEAYKNLSQLLMFGRIEMPNGALTGHEHNELKANLQLLFEGAKENQETKQEALNPLKKEVE